MPHREGLRSDDAPVRGHIASPLGPRRLARLAVASAMAVAGVALATSQGTAAAPSSPRAAGSSGDIVDVAASTSRQTAFVSTDLSALEAASSVVGNVAATVASNGDLVVAGRTSLGHVLVFTSSPTLSTWSDVDATALADAPLAASAPCVIVAGGVTSVFYETTSGDLEEMEDNRASTDPWFASDLTTIAAATGATTISGTPVAIDGDGYPLVVYARATDGDLVSFSLTATPSAPWYFVDVTRVSLGPQIAGAPAVVPAPDGGGITAVYALTATGALYEFADDDAGWHLWSARDVSSTLGLPPLAAPPAVLPGVPVVVASAGTSGHLVTVSIPTVTLDGATTQDLTADTGRTVAPSRGVSIAPGRSGYVVAAVTTASHLVIFDVPSVASSAASEVDATMQAGTELFVASAPVALVHDGTLQVLGASGGEIGIASRIVLDAQSQDQYHAKVQDTPSGSDCNPYTAYFERGSTKGCALGTAAEEWCSDFSDWVWTKAGVDTDGITGASATFVTWGRAHDQFIAGTKTAPVVGDAVVWGVLSPLYGAHVGIVVAVSDGKIDVVSGNSGNLTVASYVWDSGLFVPSTMDADGDPIIGYVSPTALKSAG